MCADNNGAPGDVVPAAKVVASQDGTSWMVSNVPAGTYWLVETKAPAGFSLLAQPVKVMLSANDQVAGPVGSIVTLQDSDKDFVAVDGITNYKLTVENVAGGALPRTGGLGVGVPIAIAVTLVVAGALIARRSGA